MGIMSPFFSECDFLQLLPAFCYVLQLLPAKLHSVSCAVSFRKHLMVFCAIKKIDMIHARKGTTMTAARRQRFSLIICLVASLFLYAYGVVSASCIPVHIDSVVLPLDFMVGIPLGFYLLVIKPRRLTLLCVIPVIWIGYALSVFALGSPSAGILPYLLCALIPVELAIAIRECRKLIEAFKSSKAKSADPMVWFKETMLYLVQKEAPASMAAAELSVWYYALLSWRKKSYALSGEKTFTYHNAGGYMNMMLGLALALPVEIIGVHFLISRVNVVVACVVTALSIYAAIWLIGDARARVMRPITVGDDRVRLECGIQMQAEASLSDVEKICHSEEELFDMPKSEKLNYGTFYQANVWIVFKKPVQVCTMLGVKSVRAIGLSIDDPAEFAECLKRV